ncbi:MFS transporter [Bosea sp. 2KB_26]|uniref:MFS transporter n=1 Tax=Bosea sp. 2KB_26 TaxID=3237475 RepID=UPI003F90C094
MQAGLRTLGGTTSPHATKARSLALLLLAETLAMAAWFASAAAVAAIRREQPLDPLSEVLLTSSVQAGFVLGTLASSLLGLADRFDPRRLFALSGAAAAALTASLALLPPVGPVTITLRVLTGLCMAGIYPVGMRIAATWANKDLGLLIGLLVGALVIGSASPHLLGAFEGIGWRGIYLGAAASTLCGALLILFAGLGPHLVRRAGLALGQFAQAWRNPALRLANAGYCGHMWELYAMWAWLGVFLQQTVAGHDPQAGHGSAAVLTFFAVASGALGAWLGGWLADRLGRTAVTIGAMAISGACALAIGWLAAAPVMLALVASLWGISAVADSAQFSASVAELAEPSLVGTMITAQTCAGFLVTLVSIHLVPHLVLAFGWTAAFSVLALGPAAGCWAMWRLRRHPDASRLAGGNR